MKFLRVFLFELGSVFRDSGALLILVGGVAIYSLVYPLPYAPEVLREVDVAVVDLDRTALSRQLVRLADAAPEVRVTQRIGSLLEARSLVSSGRAGGVLVIPRGFNRRVRRGERAVVGTYADAAYFLIYRQVMTGLVSAVRTMSAGIEIQRWQAAGLMDEEARVWREPLLYVPRTLFNPAQGYATYIVPAVLVLLLQQTIVIGVGLIGGTRTEQGVDIRTASAGVTATLLARTSAYLVLSLINVLWIFGVIYPVWDLSLRQGLGTIVVFLFPFLLAAILLGQVGANIFKTRESAMQTLVFASVLAVLVSGFAWPPEAMPAWIKGPAALLPSTWGISGLLRLAQMGSDLAQVGPEWVWLWALSGAYGLLAWLTLRRRLGNPDRTSMIAAG